MLPENDDFKRMSEAAVKCGMSLQEAAAAIRASVEAVLAEVFGKGLAEFVMNNPTDKTLKTVATAREWHLMNNAKKYRTRKKYKNRLIKRYVNETQRRNKAYEHTNSNYF